MANYSFSTSSILGLTHVALIFSSLVNQSTSYGIQHGERCYRNGPREPCDLSKGLSCSYITGTCACWDPKTVYDVKKDHCVGKIGEPCSSTSQNKKNHCPTNGFCLEDSNQSPLPVCKCKPKYFVTEFGTCMKSSSEGGFCRAYPDTPVQLCDPQSNLQCVSNSCQCSAEETYISSRSLCIASLGSRCNPELQNCGPNSECAEKIWDVDFETGSTAVKGYRCACKPGFSLTEDNKTCVVDYQGYCNKSSDCLPGASLQCLNGKCQCAPLSQIYDKVEKRCVNLVGMKCLPDEQDKNKIECIKFSECKAVETSFSNETEYMCSCMNGTVETKGSCLLSYNQTCGHPSGAQMCNWHQGLACNSESGLCDCADPNLTFEIGGGKSCVARIGTSCGLLPFRMIDLENGVREQRQDEETISIYIDCVTNSTCVETPIDGTNRQICVPKVFNQI